MKPVVLLDCDGVLADFVGGVLPIVREVTGKQFTHADVNEYDFCKALELDDEKREEVLFLIGSRRKFCRRLSPVPGAIDGVRMLRKIAEVFIVTSPWNSNETWTHEREDWLKSYFDIPHSHVIHCSAKHRVVGDWFVDDKVSTVLDWEQHHADERHHAVLWDTPHNRTDRVAAGWDQRVTSSWDELLAWVQQ